MNKIVKEGDRYYFYCPGCKTNMFWDSRWAWNGDYDKPHLTPGSPTSSPSIKFNYGDNKMCHLYIVNGQLWFCSDCTHELAGQIVEMEECEL